MNDFIEIPASKKSLAYRKPMLGIGINDADYVTAPKINGKQERCAYYQKWKDMLVRCYSAKWQKTRPTYIGCTVTKEWLLFSNFKSWMENQDWQNKHLDKDLILQGNKIYSPKTCLFVTREINLLLNDNKAIRGKWPIGVTFHKQIKKFRAQIYINGKSKHIGCHDSPEEAHEAYLKAKYALIKQVAMKQTEPLRSALLRYKINP